MVTDLDIWTDPGPRCGACGRETFRLLEGLCPRCTEGRDLKAAEAAEDQAMRRHYQQRLAAGTVSLKEMREGRL